MSDDLGRIRNAARDVAENVHRLARAEQRLRDAVRSAREHRLDERTIEAAIALAVDGKPHLIEAFERYARAGRTTT